MADGAAPPAPPSSAAAPSLRETALQALRVGQFETALATLNAALENEPASGRIWSDLLRALYATGNYGQAQALLLRAQQLGLQSDTVPWLAARLAELGQPQDGLRAWMAVDDAQARQAYGHALQSGQLLRAEIIARARLTRHTNQPQAWIDLASVLDARGEAMLALVALRRALHLQPDHAEAQSRIADLLQAQGDIDGAAQAYEAVLQHHPSNALAHLGLGMVRMAQGQVAQAEQHYQRAAASTAVRAQAQTLLGSVRNAQGRIDEAIALYRSALAQEPNAALTLSNLAFSLGYSGQGHSAEYQRTVHHWSRVVTQAAATTPAYRARPIAGAGVTMAAAAPALPSGRRLRIGYLSGDLRRHAVATFFEPLLRAQHQAGTLELFAYSSNPHEDEVTQRLRACTHHWRPVHALADPALTARLRADQLDVLIDLSGHTAHNRLAALAARVAPVQAHYLGYFASTGLASMDYWIGDSVVTPPEHAAYFSEKLWRLPAAWVAYAAPADAPEPQWAPADRLRLGSFNSASKLNAATMQAWAEILAQLPQADLLVKARELDDAQARQRIQALLARAGIDETRVTLHGSSAAWAEHMRFHNQVDVALDAIGSHAGVTTTCDLLWMGVPVVSMKGPVMAQRQGASILSAIGCADWVADSPQAYTSTAVRLAQQHAAHNAARAAFRARIAGTSVFRPDELARQLELAYRGMLAGRPAAAQPEAGRV